MLRPRFLRGTMSTTAIHIVSPAQFDPEQLRRLALSVVRLSLQNWLSLRQSGAVCSKWPLDCVRDSTTTDSRRLSPTSFPASVKCAGVKEANSSHMRRSAISFTSRLSCRIWKSTLRSWSRFGGLSYVAQRRPSWSTCRTTPGPRVKRCGRASAGLGRIRAGELI